MAVRYRCAGPKKKDGTRESCKYIMNGLIDKVPEDGKKYEVACPECGTITGVVKAVPMPGPEEDTEE